MGITNNERVIEKERATVHRDQESEDTQISKLPLSSASLTAGDQIRKIKEIKQHLANDYITDSEEKSLFLRTRDNNIHEWGPYIAGLNLSKTKTTFGRSELIGELLKIIPEIYDEKYVKESMIIPSDVIDKQWETCRDYAHGKDYSHGFPCLGQIGRNQYQFVGFKEGIRKRYGNNTLKKRLSEP